MFLLLPTGGPPPQVTLSLLTAERGPDIPETRSVSKAAAVGAHGGLAQLSSGNQLLPVHWPPPEGLEPT